MSLVPNMVAQLNKALVEKDQALFMLTLEMLIASTNSAKSVSSALGLRPGELYDLFQEDSAVTWKDIVEILKICDLTLVETNGTFLRGVL